ncbi:MAG: hypothetical protein RLZZ566_861 [Pseudomonadota bacterium]
MKNLQSLSNRMLLPMSGIKLVLLSVVFTLSSQAWGQTRLGTDEFLMDVRRAEIATLEQLQSEMTLSDVVLLGEIHDNPRHHELRAQLLREPALKQRNIVAEHLDAGQVVGAGDMLLSRLEQAGFDATGWQWPLHQPLFAAALDQGMTVYGGNLPRDQTRVVFKSRGSSLGVGLQALLLLAPLSDDSLAALRREIDEGHCGALPAMMFEGMMAVQRARDASMANELMQHLPAVLLSGNGHAWKHLGVPHILAANRPGMRSLSVLFLEHGPFADAAAQAEWLQSWQGKADYVWVTPPVSRPDPCLSLQKK